MGKPDRNSKSEVSNQTAVKPVIDAPGEVVAPALQPDQPVVEETAMAVAEPAYAADTMAYLAQDLPHLAAKLESMTKVTVADLTSVYDDLTPAELELLEAFNSRLAGDNDTGGEGDAVSFMSKVPLMRIYNNGEDEGRPGGMPLGGIYVQHGSALTCEQSDVKTSGLPLTFDAAVIGYYPARIFWPGEEEGTNPKVRIYPPNYPEDRPGPICQSWDRQQGVWFGSCAKCPYSPNRTREAKIGCKDELWLFLMRPDFTVYRLKLSGTSLRTGDAIKAKADQWSRRYEYFFELGTSKKVSADNKMKWYVLSADIKRTPEQKLGVPTSKGFRSAGHTFAKIIQTEWYYPQLANTYNQQAAERKKREQGAETNGTAPDQSSDAQKALKDLQAESESNNV
jgi:hypothetical protein